MMAKNNIGTTEVPVESPQLSRLRAIANNILEAGVGACTWVWIWIWGQGWDQGQGQG